MLTGFPRTRWSRLRFSKSCAVQISVKISRICEFRVIMWIMTGLLGCCSSSTLGSRANDYDKTLATLGFWLHHSPCSLGCWTNNTLAARSLPPKYSPVQNWNLKNYKNEFWTTYRIYRVFDHRCEKPWLIGLNLIQWSEFLSNVAVRRRWIITPNL